MTPPKKAMRAKRHVVVVELDVASTTRNPITISELSGLETSHLVIREI